MNFNKKILLIILGVSFHGAVMSMQPNFDSIFSESETQAMLIYNFVREKEHNQQHIQQLESWINQKRNNISNADEWNTLVNDLIMDVPSCKCVCPENEITTAVKNAIKEIILNLKPGHNCSYRLVECAQNALVKSTIQSITRKNPNANKSIG